ncbi:methionine synthase [Nocardioides mesophilus]|uniref:Methionine synthase n=1 Tax=Nocardioides mesophilus TaxID=433659 RepID=A0A7G9R8V2_9ACTN|nr:methionine synthase [Nocardioides mesophilus]QNN52027.1 methionine synthase [Nocardioides mesophilus]
MTRATGIGSLPGTDYAEAVRMVLGLLPDLAHVPELPDRGVQASMTGRSLGVLADLDADLQPAGWRLTGSQGSPGADHRRARSLLAQDLDVVEELAQDYDGTFKVQVTGPWTLAATVEKPRGDRLLADRGARRELAQALAEGLRTHVADLRRRLPRSELWVQVDEPALPAVMTGRVPTASGFHRHRSVDAPEASPALEWVFEAISSAGAVPIVHCCDADVPVGLLVGAGAAGVSVDLGVLAPAAYDPLAELLEAGGPVLLGVVPSTAPEGTVSAERLTDQVMRFLDMLGLDPDAVGESLVVTPTCGLAGASVDWARQALRLSAEVAGNL